MAMMPSIVLYFFSLGAWTMIDTYGVVGQDGTGQDWNIRMVGITEMVLGRRISGKDAVVGCITNNNCASMFPLRSYTN